MSNKSDHYDSINISLKTPSFDSIIKKRASFQSATIFFGRRMVGRAGCMIIKPRTHLAWSSSIAHSTSLPISSLHFSRKKDIDYDSVGWLKTKRSVINLINSQKTKWRLGRSWGILAMTLTNILFVKLSLIMMLM